MVGAPHLTIYVFHYCAHVASSASWACSGGGESSTRRVGRSKLLLLRLGSGFRQRRLSISQRRSLDNNTAAKTRRATLRVERGAAPTPQPLGTTVPLKGGAAAAVQHSRASLTETTTGNKI